PTFLRLIDAPVRGGPKCQARRFERRCTIHWPHRRWRAGQNRARLRGLRHPMVPGRGLLRGSRAVERLALWEAGPLASGVPGRSRATRWKGGGSADQAQARPIAIGEDLPSSWPCSLKARGCAFQAPFEPVENPAAQRSEAPLVTDTIVDVWTRDH